MNLGAMLAGFPGGLQSALESAQKRQAMDMALQDEQRKTAVMQLIGDPRLNFGQLGGGARTPMTMPQPVAGGMPGQGMLGQTPPMPQPQADPGGGRETGYIPLDPQSDAVPGLPLVPQAQQQNDATAPAPPPAADPTQAGQPQGEAQALGQQVRDDMRSFPDPLQMMDHIRDAIRKARPDADPGVVGEATLKLFGLVNNGNLAGMKLWAQLRGLDIREQQGDRRLDQGDKRIEQGDRRIDTTQRGQDLGHEDRQATEAGREKRSGQRLDLAKERLMDQRAERLLRSADKGVAAQARSIMAQRRTIKDRAKLGILSPEDQAALQKLDQQLEALEQGRAKALGVPAQQPAAP